MIILCLVFRRCILYRPPATTLPVFSRALRGEVHAHASQYPYRSYRATGTGNDLNIFLLPG